MTPTSRLILPLLLAIALPATCVADLVAQPPFPPPPQAPAPLPNNFLLKNDAGASASFSDEGFVDRADAFHTPQGTNGRSCATCHSSEAGWSITPEQIQRRFIATGGNDPIFNPQDANGLNADVSSLLKRKKAYSLLLSGLFRRGGGVLASREFEVTAADDPNGVGSTTRFSFYRRPLTTANMKLITGVLWDDRLTVAGDGSPPRQGLFNQARGNITGAQEGPPPSAALVNAIVDEELQIWQAQLAVPGVGRLDSCGGRGGPELLSQQPLVAGRWDLFDAWIGFTRNRCDSTRFGAERRAQIARGQEIFNERTNADGRTCRGCHNVVNNGTNQQGRLFDIGVSAEQRRTPGLPLYTLRKTQNALPTCTPNDDPIGTEVKTTDPGKAFVTGCWSDISRFKVPTLRGVVTRAPYFHNGIAKTLLDVVRHYDAVQGFRFTRGEEQDLVAFLNAL